MPFLYPDISKSSITYSGSRKFILSVMHIGKRIKEVLAEQGKTSLWLARQLSYNRTTMYKIYDKASLDTQILLRISRIMNYDFFQEFSKELASINYPRKQESR